MTPVTLYISAESHQFSEEKMAASIFNVEESAHFSLLP
jgi:hypothetical protein